MTSQSDKIITVLRPRYIEKVAEIRALHQQGCGGLQVVRALSDLADQLLLKGFQLIDPLLAQQWGGALIAIGGYGRQEMSPGSDIDLMFLLPEGHENEAKTEAAQLLQLLWDLGYTVGHSVRTVEECVSLAREDALIATSLLESRFLHGDRLLFKQFHKTFFSKVIDKNLKTLLKYLAEEREQKSHQYGATPYLLEPNLKQSPGGLRDIQTLKWTAAARYRTYHLPQIHQWGHLSNIEYASLVQAQDYLWRIRNQLHFLAGKASDHLTIELQEEIAPFFHFDDRRGLMREYYVHTGRILEISKRFIRDAFPLSRRQKWSRSWKTRRVAQGFQIYEGEISTQSLQPFDFFQDDENTLRLFLLAKSHSARIADAILETLHQVTENKKDQALAPGALALFKTLMTKPGGIAKTIAVMHQIRLLWRIIPEFSRIHYLVQKSRSHAYTVDEHSIRAVEAAEALQNEGGPIQEIYAAVPHKDLLHLAILLHDIGKGSEEDHSAVGAKVAEAMADRLGYNQAEKDRLIFLVRQHLSLSQVALFRDFENEPVLLQFVKEIPDLETLQALFIVTCADIRATAPGMWSEWKADLLVKLYRAASELLSGTDPNPKKKKAMAIREQVHAAVQGQYPEAWLREILHALSIRYLLATPFEKVFIDLAALFELQHDPIQVKARFLSDQGVTEYTLYTYDWITGGLFCKMTGVLSAKGLEILAAQVFTHPNGMIIDTFQVIDPDYTERVPQDRIDSISEAAKRVLIGEETVEDQIAKGRRFSRRKKSRAKKQTVKVELDNDSSHTFTVIDIYAADSKGLLYLIAKTIFELGLVVRSAKIATRLDQVVDVFYVLGLDQKKITHPAAMENIKDRLHRQIQLHFLDGGA